MLNSDSGTVFVVEDSIAAARLYANCLESAGYRVESFATGQAALEALQANLPGVLLLDVQLPDLSGLEILKFVASRQMPVGVIVMTAHGSVDIAVEAIRGGALDFIEKPFGKDRLLLTVNNAMRRRDLETMVQTYRDGFARDEFAGFHGRSLAMQVVYRIVDSAAATRATVFVTGESGSGKGLCARAIHERSERSAGLLVPVNCAALAGPALEVELFGSNGEGTGVESPGALQRAHRGTLLLDEICAMDPAGQRRLLHFMQSGKLETATDRPGEPLDVRLVCTASNDPHAAVAAGAFSEELLYRLNVIPVHLPPLREREDDVLLLAQRTLLQAAREEGKEFDRLSAEVESAFLSYDWPGNVRELENVVRNVVMLNQGVRITLRMLPDALTPGTPRAGLGVPRANAAGLKVVPNSGSRDVEPLWKVEQRAIEAAIAQFGGSVPAAAAALGIGAATVYRKRKAWQSMASQCIAPRQTNQFAGRRQQRE